MNIPLWTYRNKLIQDVRDLPEKIIGFIYEIEFTNDQKYIGKKLLIHKRTLKPLKGKSRKRIKYIESDWKTYYGSIKNKEFIEKLKKEEINIRSRKILQVCYSKGDLTYYETKWQFVKNVLESEKYLNSNILGKFYKRIK